MLTRLNKQLLLASLLRHPLAFFSTYKNNTSLDSNNNQPQSDEGPLNSFADIDMPPKMKQYLSQKFPVMTEIQHKTITKLFQKKDLVGIAQTGSGKTLAYGIPALVHARTVKDNTAPAKMQQGPISLVLCPTRQLATQIQDHLRPLGSLIGVNVFSIYGGASKYEQIRAIGRRSMDLLIATPGRLNDFLESREFEVRRSSFLTLDEADRMLDIGFYPQIKNIINGAQQNKQVSLFSATWEPRVQEIANNHLRRDYEYIQIGNSTLTINKNIKQSFLKIAGIRNKIDKLIDILKEDNRQSTFLVFVNTKNTARNLQEDIESTIQGCRVSRLEGDQAQRERSLNLNLFKEGRTKVLIATDVASRGLDISNLSCVINFDVPMDPDSYIHRIGRTGRAGKQGSSITFIEPDKLFPGFLKGLREAFDKSGIEFPEELSQEYKRLRSNRGGRYEDLKSTVWKSSNRLSGSGAFQSRRKYGDSDERRHSRREDNEDPFDREEPRMMRRRSEFRQPRENNFRRRERDDSQGERQPPRDSSFQRREKDNNGEGDFTL